MLIRPEQWCIFYRAYYRAHAYLAHECIRPSVTSCSRWCLGKRSTGPTQVFGPVLALVTASLFTTESLYTPRASDRLTVLECQRMRIENLWHRRPQRCVDVASASLAIQAAAMTLPADGYVLVHERKKAVKHPFYSCCQE